MDLMEFRGVEERVDLATGAQPMKKSEQEDQDGASVGATPRTSGAVGHAGIGTWHGPGNERDGIKE